MVDMNMDSYKILTDKDEYDQVVKNLAELQTQLNAYIASRDYANELIDKIATEIETLQIRRLTLLEFRERKQRPIRFMEIIEC